MSGGMVSTVEGTTRARGLSIRTAAALIVLFVAASLLIVSGSASAEVDEPESHCVLEVLDVLLGGEFVVSAPKCFDSFDAAMAFVSGGALTVNSGKDLFTTAPDMSKAFRTGGTRDKATRTRAANTTNGTSSFVIGIHFTGRYGGGSSVTLTGTNCSGGYWNASSSWRNVISSSYNGCARLAHYSELYISGSRYDTRTSGQTDNISGYMDNRTKSIRYLGY